MDILTSIFYSIYLLVFAAYMAWNICALGIVASYHFQRMKQKQELKKLQEKWRLAK